MNDTILAKLAAGLHLEPYRPPTRYLTVRIPVEHHHMLHDIAVECGIALNENNLRRVLYAVLGLSELDAAEAEAIIASAEAPAKR